jgi:hypothetical protein
MIQPKDVESCINFVKPDSTVNRRYITPGLELNTGKYETRTIVIRDARPFREDYTLDRNGFQLFNHTTKVFISTTMD